MTIALATSHNKHLFLTVSTGQKSDICSGSPKAVIKVHEREHLPSEACLVKNQLSSSFRLLAEFVL